MKSLVDLLRYWAAQQPDHLAYLYLREGEIEEARLTYGELDEKARAIAATLQQMGAQGERALLLYHQGLDFIAAFFGCLYAGVTAVPVYPPKMNRNMIRLEAIATDATPKFSLTTGPIWSRVEPMLADQPELQKMQWLATDEVDTRAAAGWNSPQADEATLAFIQYTSGSTGTPKGVMVSHGNLLHNEAMITEAFSQHKDSLVLGWLPLYHDMGLIGNVLQPLYVGASCILMSPVDFLQHPIRWLQAISSYKATTSGGPNFAYELCARKVTPEQIAALDLSSWTVAFNGAEPINPDVLDLFADTFAPAGFRKEAFFPCYGLAEATLFVTGGAQTELPIVKAVEKEALNGNRVVFCEERSDRTQLFVSSGHAFLEQRVLIVNPETGIECPAAEVGEIWVKGPSAAQGYWQKPELSAATFAARITDTGEGPFMRTGDLGFMQDGELYVTGRLKDLIIIRGRNHYPQDIENTVAACHPALKPGAGAAFSVDVHGEERLVLVQEVERAVWRSVNVEEVSAAVRQAVAYHHELQVHAVVLIKPASIPKTSSGKIQRHACRNQFLDGTLATIASDVLASDASEAVVDLSREELLALPEADRGAALTSFLTGACAAVIGVTQKQIAPEQSLHALGMDSLMAVELKHRVEASFGVELTMGDVLDGPSVNELTALILSRIDGAGAVAALDSVLADVAEFPLSYGQKALYFLQSVNPQSAAYNISKALRITASLDEQQLQVAYAALLARHPQLRVTFDMLEDQPVQRVAEDAEASFAVLDAAGLSDEQVLAAANAEANRPFDLKKGPLLRMTLWKRGERDHLLVIAAHHIAVDFWSFGVLLKEFGALYAGTPLPAGHGDRYFDYVRWQQELLQSAEGERMKAFWQQQLSGPLPVLDLPADRTRPAVLSERGAALPFVLPEELTGRLKALAKESGATLYAVLLAAFQALLHRYTAQEDIVVGSPSAGRSAAKFADTVGYFVNPVVLRSLVASDAPFAELVGQVKHSVRAALKHQDYPFPLLVEQLQPNRDASYPPLFNVMFNLQSGALWKEDALVALAMGQGGAKLTAGGLPMESVALTQEHAQFDLSLMMGEADGKLSGVFEYSTALFDRATIERMSGHLATLLGGIAEDPSRAIADLPLLTAAEQALLPAWNGALGTLPDAALHQLVEAQVERTPDAAAVVYEDTVLTFAELNARANRTARALQAHGVSADVPVGICMERSPELVIALLAVLKAGGAYVPLDPSYPQERLAWIAEDTQVPVVLTQSSLVDTVPARQAKLICLDSAAEMLNEYGADNLNAVVEPHQLAYILYTSGSTGRPKGVEIPHRAIVNHMLWMLDAYPMGSTDKILQKTPIGFDASVWEFWAPLLSGATLVMARPGGHRDSGYLAQTVKEHGITVLQLVPTMLGLLLEEPELTAGTALKHVFCGGEALPLDLQTRFFQVLDAGLHNLYGPTECTIDATFWDCKQGFAGRSVPIGRPVTNTQVYVLDAQLRPVPALALGELHIGGAGLARGYHNRPDLTAEKFVTHPESGERLYKTGDLARFLPDGTLEYAGRLDHQVKIRGFRIELGEIEAVLKEHPDVRDAVVTAREEHGDQRLIAYLIAAAAPNADLRGFVKQKLPEYMVPAAFVLLDAFPLLPNGKVDLKSLPAPTLGQTTSATPYIAPATPTEEKLAALWSDVLGVERIGTADNFFERGGHSLMAMQIVTRVRRQFSVELPVARLFETPTIAQLAAVIDASGTAPAKPKKPAMSKLSRAAHRIDS
ncbi:amino acid adenylation domain-containing protein [Tumebacillus sp. BK434]|uniref:non-ribosomal peptide synthetase n=1 Tax=Tumebacillus sp. BK434 TaxID=2512169 RepID=UPI0010EA8293|nr:non-ribosomal peptide synthetase [Tumebacillus sp. BK434]TCP57971.1 amino acid adenylation domain-containing protein [Tumebacillus sp. BK434]